MRSTTRSMLTEAKGDVTPLVSQTKDIGINQIQNQKAVTPKSRETRRNETNEWWDKNGWLDDSGQDSGTNWGKVQQTIKSFDKVTAGHNCTEKRMETFMDNNRIGHHHGNIRGWSFSPKRTRTTQSWIVTPQEMKWWWVPCVDALYHEFHV